MLEKKRTKPALQRREDLLDAAEVLFIENGIQATRIEDIARNAGVAKGTLYLYFSNKDDLLDGLQSRFIDKFMQAQNLALTSADKNIDAQIQAWVKSSVHTFIEYCQLHDLVFHQYQSSKHESRNSNPAIESLAHILDQFSEHERTQNHLLATVLFNGFHGAVDLFNDQEPKTINEAELVNWLKKLFIKTLN